MRYFNILQIICCVLLCLCLAAPAAAKARKARAVVPPAIPQERTLEVVSAILYDMDGEAILFEQNADQPIQPASLTKVLSMFVAMDHIMAGHARMNTTVPISAHAAGTGGSVMGIRPNEVVTLEQLLFGMAVSSGNDASAAVAEFVGGSEQAFVRMMNVKAARLGMKRSHFRTPHGLPDPAQYTTARDMLTLGRAYLRTYPQNLRFHNTRVLNHNNRLSWNRNPLLMQYDGADGLKTGWVRASGFNLISTARRDGRRLMAVVLGAHDAGNRGVETCRLLDAGFMVLGGKAASVAEALEGLDRESYALDIHRTAQEAHALYPTAREAKPLGARGSKVAAGGKRGKKSRQAQRTPARGQKDKAGKAARSSQRKRQAAQNSRAVLRPGG